MGAALEADHEAESSGKIRDIERRKVEDSNRGFFGISAPTRALITLEIPRLTIAPLLERHFSVPASRVASQTSLW